MPAPKPEDQEILKQFFKSVQKEKLQTKSRGQSQAALESMSLNIVNSTTTKPADDQLLVSIDSGDNQIHSQKKKVAIKEEDVPSRVLNKKKFDHDPKPIVKQPRPQKSQD